MTAGRRQRQRAGRRVLAAVLASGLTLGSAADCATGPVRYQGVNLGAGSFGSKKIPGVAGKDYRYPTADEASPFLAIGMNAVRVPILWERIQPIPLQDLDKAELRRLDESLARLDGFALVIIDVHNYAAYRGKKLTGTDGAERLSDLWSRLARHYRSRKNIAFGLMNEPNGISAREWRGIAEAGIAAIRATGARNMILMPGTSWSGAHSWMKGGAESNAAVLAGLSDPADNLVFEMHQYFDSDSSGTGPSCITPQQATARLDDATRWLRQEHARGLLGEFGASADPACLAVLDQVLTKLDRNADVWIGWTYWAAGDWWGKYFFNVQPAKSVDKPQFAVLREHVPARGRNTKR